MWISGNCWKEAGGFQWYQMVIIVLSSLPMATNTPIGSVSCFLSLYSFMHNVNRKSMFSMGHLASLSVSSLARDAFQCGGLWGDPRLHPGGIWCPFRTPRPWTYW